MVVAFLPMYVIAVAYSELNKVEPDCGTTFTWAARAFGTRTAGFTPADAPGRLPRAAARTPRREPAPSSVR
jgi:hypothetical protein